MCRPALSPADPPGYCITRALYLWLKLSEREAPTHCHVLRTLSERGTTPLVSPRCCTAWYVVEDYLFLCTCRLDWIEQAVLGVKFEKRVVMRLYNEFKAHTKTFIDVGRVSFFLKRL
jgi:hypothetical protein